MADDDEAEELDEKNEETAFEPTVVVRAGRLFDLTNVKLCRFKYLP